MREYIVQYERKEADNPKDKCDLCEHAIVGEVVRCLECKWNYVKQVTEHLNDLCGTRREDGDIECLRLIILEVRFILLTQ